MCITRFTRQRAFGAALLLLPLLFARPAVSAPTSHEPLVALARSAVVPQALRDARPLGRLSPETTVTTTLSLSWRNQGDLADLLRRLNDFADPQYKKFLTARQFSDRFAPTQADVDAVLAWAKEAGLNVVGISGARNLVTVSGPRDAVESAFHVRLNWYALASGRVVFANDAAPRLPRSLALRLNSIMGLTDYARPRPLLRRLPARPLADPMKFTGTGPQGGLAPADIRAVYNIKSLSDNGLDGSGETIALYEQDGYNTADIVAYCNEFGLPDPTVPDPNNNNMPRLQTILTGTFNGKPVDANTQIEVSLDIEMILAVAPKARILVYEGGPNDPNFSIATLLAQIVTDNKATLLSVSYGLSEDDANLGGILQPISTTFQQAEAEGMCVYVASGDTGAYNEVTSGTSGTGTTGTTSAFAISVSSPASDPNVVAVGGTTLLTVPNYTGEKTWNNSGLPSPEGSGGGVSKFFGIPAYQLPAATAAPANSLVSTTKRNVPDVSLNADPQTGYTVIVTPALNPPIVGGTSAACPLWAAYNALVNQQRLRFGLPRLGFANPQLYLIAQGANYGADFHDIADGSTNLQFPAVKGFDDATGLGSFVADKLLSDLAPTVFNLTTLGVKVIDTSGNPISGATITITSPQLPGAQSTATSAADGTASFQVYTGIHNFNNTNQDAAITYTVAVDQTGKAGQSIADVMPPATVTLTLRDADHTYAGGKLQMISAPFDYSTVGDFFTLFGSTLPSGGTPRLYAYSPTLNAYLAYPTAPADTLRLGQGYWALLPVNAYTRRSGVPAPLGQPFRINLLPGWNQIGDPFQGSVSVGSIQVDTIPPSTPVGISSAGSVQFPLYYWDGTQYQAVGTGDALQPFQGYWIHASKAVSLVVPAQ